MQIKELNFRELNPDGYSRFFIMAYLVDLLYQNRSKNSSIKVLDVGGASPYMYQALSTLNVSMEITIIDTLKYKVKNKIKKNKIIYVQGNATDMPFEDNLFDIVVSTDVLEHIPKTQKEKFVEECVRVCRDFCIIACPFNTPGVDLAEHQINKLNKKLFNIGQKWLEEHFENLKPEINQVTNLLKKHHYNYEIIGTNNLYFWLVSAGSYLINAKFGIYSAKLKKLNQLYADNIYTSGEINDPSYRQFVVVYKKSRTLNLKSKLDEVFNINTDYSTAIRYISGVLNIIADSFLDLVSELSKKTKQIDVAQKQGVIDRNKIKELQTKIEEQNKLLKNCKLYLKIRNIRIVKKLLKNVAYKTRKVKE